MTVKIRKKDSRQRGTMTHGWGSKKKHRGAGNRGGKGRAGSGKRADSKKPSIWKNKLYFGRRHFRGRSKKVKAVNISFIDENTDKLGIKEDKGFYVVDLKKLGYDKLLGTGKVSKKFKIKAKHASKKAVEAVNKAGGEIIVIEKELVKKLMEHKENK